MKKMIVVCDGKKMSHAFEFVNLFRYVREEETIKNSISNYLNVELFSYQSYLHSSLAKNDFLLIIGDLLPEYNVTMKYDSSGMKYGFTKSIARITVESISNILLNYDHFFCELIKREERYFDLEETYTKRIGKGRSKKIKWYALPTQKSYLYNQCYRFISYDFYENALENFIKEKLYF